MNDMNLLGADSEIRNILRYELETLAIWHSTLYHKGKHER